MRPGAEPVAAVFGEWNTTNLGDRAIRRGVAGFFAACGWRTEGYALGAMLPADGAPGSARPHPGGARHLSPRLERALRGARQRLRGLRLVPALAHADAILVGGGALLSDANLRFPQSLSVLRSAARLLGKPLLCLGCGAEGGWSSAGARRIRAFAAACDLLCVRDRTSAARLEALTGQAGIPVFGDFCLAESDLRRQDGARGARGRIAVNVASAPWHAAARQREFEDALVAELRAWLAGGRAAGAVTIFTTGAAHDEPPARRVAARLAGAGVELCLPRELETLEALLGSSALVVAARLHAAVIALAQGAPVVGFSAASKVGDFLETLSLGEFSCAIEDGGRLRALLSRLDPGAAWREQRSRALGAPVWPARSAVQRLLRAGAARGMRPRHEHADRALP